MLIGICGKSGSGKSTVARMICELKPNTRHYDIDRVGHECLIIPEVQEKLILAFGETIIKDNIVDRKKIGALVFADKSNMKILTDITWPYMERMIDKIIQENKDNNIILDWILLSMTKYFAICDIKILVDTPYEVRKQRAIKRDGISEEKFDLREQASIEYNNQDFDLVISNNDLQNIRKLVKQL